MLSAVRIYLAPILISNHVALRVDLDPRVVLKGRRFQKPARQGRQQYLGQRLRKRGMNISLQNGGTGYLVQDKVVAFAYLKYVKVQRT